ncbi:hypothetical protein KFK09_023238 [Dendrobium nobile]|uniref:2-Cys peroxiredoxin BAS1, chloroplastic n=1 Tax=Dendrobium nobile TaxID=94219 RepID=A0A8T3AM72_DENNO|nr:hypothetical protein KFK09_023238 [Dendrobium nobile]
MLNVTENPGIVLLMELMPRQGACRWVGAASFVVMLHRSHGVLAVLTSQSMAPICQSSPIQPTLHSVMPLAIIASHLCRHRHSNCLAPSPTSGLLSHHHSHHRSPLIVKLSDYIGKKHVILFFYPLNFTFVCPTEITAFSDRHPEFEKLNTEILGVSVDSKFSHLAWIQTDRKAGGLGNIQYPLISDVTKSVSRSYGVLIPDQGIALRGLFIIDKEGVIQHSTINNLAIGRSVDETMRTLQALQYVQENPDEVCPAGWKPGEKSMKPDPKLSKEYFAAI